MSRIRRYWKIIVLICGGCQSVAAQVVDSVELTSRARITQTIDSILAVHRAHSPLVLDDLMTVTGAQTSIDTDSKSRPLILNGKYITTRAFLELIAPEVVTWRRTELSDTMHLYFKTDNHPVLHYFAVRGQILHEDKLYPFNAFPTNIAILDTCYFTPEITFEGKLRENVLVIKSKPFPDGVFVVPGHKYKSEGPPLHIEYYDVNGIIYTQEELVKLAIGRDEIHHQYLIYGQKAVERYGDRKYSSGVKVMVLKKQ